LFHWKSIGQSAFIVGVCTIFGVLDDWIGLFVHGISEKKVYDNDQTIAGQ
jgi:hypothetical protein